MEMKELVFVVVICLSSFVACLGDTNPSSEALLLRAPPKRQPGFKYFLLALQWPNQYCSTTRCNPPIPTQDFTIHGLWPQAKDGAVNCKTKEVLTDETLEELRDNYELLTYWPDLKNAEDFESSKKFWRDEWKKHGTCSANKFKALDYFQKSIYLAKMYSDKISQALKDRGVKADGGSYRQLDILHAVVEATGSVPSLSLTDTGSGKSLAEIRLCVKDDALTLCDNTFIKFAGPPAVSPPPRSTGWVSYALEQ
ncbi:ribonuclease 1-like [Neltuma alba]|uniref:ribonuclease 1-like n=1 Tax=Neltuma alba TaxID=207710 RepID=UPI0010A33D22|nr:ribonuclease 1-like [Prosopis alba]